jgi:hypothetical protein
MIRRQIRAESKLSLTDDVLLAAYQQEGSVRKAATFLSESTGQIVSKDRVQNALRKIAGMSEKIPPRNLKSNDAPLPKRRSL